MLHWAGFIDDLLTHFCSVLMATIPVVSAFNRCHSGVQSGSRPTCTKYPCWNLRSWISLCRAWKTMVSDNKWSQFYLRSVWRWLLPGVVVYVHLPYPKIDQKIVICILLTISLGQQSLMKPWFTNKLPFTSQLHHSESYQKEEALWYSNTNYYLLW